MKNTVLLMLATFLAGFSWSQSTETLSATITSSHAIHGVPSASGLESKKGKYYVIGDDSPWLFELDSNLQITRSLLIHTHQNVINGRIAKVDKPDYEAMVTLKWGADKDMLIFGSGSDVKRNVMVRVGLSGSGYSVKSYPLDDFYAEIRKQGNIAPADFNIEGAASWGEFLILMNRGTNQLILINSAQFQDYLKNQNTPKKRKNFSAQFFKFDLPIEGGVQARFSGGTKVSGEDVLVFTASMEQTGDWVADGVVTGSYIGLIDLNKLRNSTVPVARVTKDGRPFSGKIESVDCVEVNKKKLKITGVTDNDKGDSEFLYIELSR
jgi:hypothetical protein